MLLSAAVGFSALSVSHTARAQALFVGDVGDNSVKQFDASGAYLGTFVPSGTAGLNGPMGMIFSAGQLTVVNQNIGTKKSSIPGEVLEFNGTTGDFIGKLVASSDRNAPFAPRGVVRGGPNHDFYVADLGLQDDKCVNQGNIKEYNDAGAFVGNLDRSAFTPEFHPRGVVFGPDGLLYVSAVGCLNPKDKLFNPLTGYILRFNARTKAFVDQFASNGTIGHLHRPEGLVFDSAGNLWVTSFRASSADSDRVLELDATGHLRAELVLSTPPAPRAYAQAIIFGPGGNLFIPITGGDATTAGQLRSCNPLNLQCTNIVQAGGPLKQPYYLIFRNSDPTTLNYNQN
jgi:hypothetical protein